MQPRGTGPNRGVGAVILVRRVDKAVVRVGVEIQAYKDQVSQSDRLIAKIADNAVVELPSEPPSRGRLKPWSRYCLTNLIGLAPA